MSKCQNKLTTKSISDFVKLKACLDSYLDFQTSCYDSPLARDSLLTIMFSTSCDPLPDEILETISESARVSVRYIFCSDGCAGEMYLRNGRIVSESWTNEPEQIDIYASVVRDQTINPARPIVYMDQLPF